MPEVASQTVAADGRTVHGDASMPVSDPPRPDDTRRRGGRKVGRVRRSPVLGLDPFAP